MARASDVGRTFRSGIRTHCAIARHQNLFDSTITDRIPAFETSGFFL
jgi:hypothetical protein